ncbi:MAG: MMPL family transporter [Edaphocola sp.]
MHTIFTGIYDFFEKRKSTYWLSLLAVVGTLAWGASGIRLENDINKMIPHDRSIEAMNEVVNNTQAGAQVVFTLSFKDSTYGNADSLIGLEQLLERQLSTLGKGKVAAINAKANEEKQQQFAALAMRNLPLLLTDSDYTTIDSLLQPERLTRTLRTEKELLESPAGLVLQAYIVREPLGIFPLALKKFQALQYDPGYELHEGYIFSDNGKRLTFFLQPAHPASDTKNNAQLFKEVDRIINEWAIKRPGIGISYFGGPAVAAANAVQMQQDTIVTLCVTIAALLLLTFYVFKSKRAPVLLMVPVLFGGLCGLATMAWVQGTVSVLAIGAGAVILGIAIDFSVHFMSHARSHPAMRDNVATLVFPLTLGALTTIGAFLALRLANAPLLRDLGLFAASNLIGASLFTLIFLPHLIDSNQDRNKTEKPNLIDRLARLKPERNKWLLLAVVLATPVLWHFAGKVSFDNDLMHLNYLSPKLKAAQDDLNKHNAYALSSVFAVATGHTEDEALQKLQQASPIINRLQATGKIKNALNPVSIMPPLAVQLRRIERWRNFWTEDKINTTLAALSKAAKEARFDTKYLKLTAKTLRKQYQPYDSTERNFLAGLLPNTLGSKNGKYYAVASLKVMPGKRKDVLEAVSRISSISATDRQSVSEQLLAILHTDFNKILYYSGALVFLALLIAYGRPELALISFLPMALTWVWILGVMGILGLRFNIVNIIVSTLIFGLGDDYSIFMMDGMLEQYRTGKSNMQQSRSAVYLSVLTTIVGLGTLIFAKHPALHSIALISILGLVCVVFVSQVLQPFLFNFMIQHRADKGFMPFTLWSLLKSAFSFLYFFAGCLIVTLAGFILTGLTPFGKQRSKYIFHWFLSKYTGSVMYVMANVKKRFYGYDKSVFNKPAVYIANHSSFLDILLTTMLHPKLVLLTNKWVWRSPAFGKIVRMAEYYPVADGAEDSIEPLKSLVEKGYGIIVFPEGTRSYDDTIHRFHKGACYIAEQLNLPIVPVILHGAHYAMQKSDWLLKNGTTSVYVQPAIAPNDKTYGEHYSQRTRLAGKYFRSKFEEIKQGNETPKYFREQLIKGNIYKGPVLEWYCRIKTKLEDNYEPFHQLLPRTGRFYDLGCGYGFMTYMLHWASEGRTFTGVDYDEGKITTAANHYLRLKEKKLRLRMHKDGKSLPETAAGAAIDFICADVTGFPLEPCDGIIISDVLHYLDPAKQLELLGNCHKALRNGGKLILRDGVKDLAERHKGTQLTEVLSTKIIKFNKTQNALHFLERAFVEQWAATNNMKLRTLDLTKNTSNIIFVLEKE